MDEPWSGEQAVWAMHGGSNPVAQSESGANADDSS
jgi:hypothetical protein